MAFTPEHIARIAEEHYFKYADDTLEEGNLENLGNINT